MATKLEGHWPTYARDEIGAATAVLESGRVNYWTGDECKAFEEEYARHCGTNHAIALANGSVSLEIALDALGIGDGDEVIVTPRSFIASASCVIRVGATPVFADVDRDSQNITAESIEPVLTSKTKAIIPVHHAGWPCDMDPIMAIARENDLYVIEDCAQAHGATYKDRPVGGIGHIGSFSFCQDKIITTGGEGGMLVMNDEKIWKRCWSLKDHGKDYDVVFNQEHPAGFRWLHEDVGTNLRMTELQAAIGRVQLRKLPTWRSQRQANARQLKVTLSGYDAVRIPSMPAEFGHAFYRLYVFLRPERLKRGWSQQRILESFGEHGIPVFSGGCAEIYREKAFASRGLAPKSRLPIAAELGETSLAFLVHPTMTESDLEKTCNAIQAIFDRATS